MIKVYNERIDKNYEVEASTVKELAQKLDIKFRTTIVVYKGNNEVARIIGQTDKETIYSAIKKGI